MRTPFFLFFFGVLCAASLSAQSDKPQGQLAIPAESAGGAKSVPPDSTEVELIKRVEPVYPLQAQMEKIQGRVTVRIVISTTGDVAEVSVLSGPPVLAASVVAAVKQWKFSPFFRGGVPASAKVTLPPFDFAFAQTIVDIKDEQQKAEVRPDVKESDKPLEVKGTSEISGGVLLHKVVPTYPLAAQAKGIRGTVVLSAVIAKDGTLKNVKVISGPKELVESAISAVQQWRYSPYKLRGEPFEAETKITLNY